jgi:hypothetical protein
LKPEEDKEKIIDNKKKEFLEALNEIHRLEAELEEKEMLLNRIRSELNALIKEVENKHEDGVTIESIKPLNDKKGKMTLLKQEDSEEEKVESSDE